MSERSGGQLVVDQLRRHGVERVFCVPGESYLDVLDALHDSPIETVVCRHEGGAAYMAEACGKLHGRPGVAMVTRGPGAANALVALHTAWQDATPVLLFVGLVPTAHRHREAFQEFDLRGWFGTTAKAVLTLDDPARAPELVARAVHEACTGRPGPVVIGVPEDVLVRRAEVDDVAPLPVSEGGLSGEDIAALGEMLARARRPLVVLGGSRWDADSCAAVTKWCERWEIPVATEFRSQDRIDHSSETYAGALGYGRDERLVRRLEQADLVLLIGGPLTDVNSEGFTVQRSSDARTVLISPDSSAWAHGTDLDRQIVASPSGFASAVQALPATGECRWREWTKAARQDHLDYATPKPDGSKRVDLGVVMAELAARLPHDAIITYGAGNHAIWAQRYLQHRVYPSLLSPRNGSMGYGVPAAVAAALSFPERQVVSVAGDGCFLMNAQELATAVSRDAKPLILVVDNGEYGTIRDHQEREYPGRVSGTALQNPDFAVFARSFGAFGEKVESTEDIGGALDRALASGTAAVLHLVTDPDVRCPS
ncbi:thiamine pyrophosphate-binding protein [Saccharopolyspora erythraea]|uniref:thiamine pyrophosphate-binding protein n=1 Tax=Saccharopolyspora erythraea TaxID=1836 RepID=UPI001BABB4C1|nr:thiamine pyrophosphate-binding protein [Saccharopolyspora erythraea]QUH04038.1 thiamine pyrophosphate-binding protein [Saccharopolyspora erythraea]